MAFECDIVKVEPNLNEDGDNENKSASIDTEQNFEFKVSLPAGALIPTNLTNSIETLSSKLAAIQHNQALLSSNQVLILEKLTNLSTQFDELMQRISVGALTGKSERDIDNRFKPITNKKCLDDFEESLKSKHKTQEFKKILSIVCGKGKGRAINNAYALLDAMFGREFLTTCSWAGGTRAEGSKICFKSYQNTIDLFFTIVHMSDENFTMQECYSFLKSILRNAKKRSTSKNLRISRQRRRGKSKKTEDNGLNNLIQSPGLNNVDETTQADTVDYNVNEEDINTDEDEELDLC
ncbi:hypothetical protein B5X24_HaOG205920 [Helicoverpa armigera]|uniref:DUF4806 domain-containing protein n=1 Tax=Helicoverpa armigera TaxID=29058 RepID=A0A2W1BPS0_HELAM|nr:hypothetical protein B5X24_HaOG205920 [Helicoverpa armigera]